MSDARPVSGDLDAPLTDATIEASELRRHDYTGAAGVMDDLAAALRECRADYLAALDVIARLTEGWDVSPIGIHWYRHPFLTDDGETYTDEMSDREWRVFCEAAQRAHRSRT